MDTNKSNEEKNKEENNIPVENQNITEEQQVAPETTTEEEVQEEEHKDEKEKKSFFGIGGKKAKDELAEKNKQLTDELAETKAKLDELQDKYMRQVAEFSNFKKRTAKEKIELRENVKSSMLLDFLPVIDDIDRAMEHISATDVEATVEGIKLIYQKFMDFLRAQELSEIEALGQEFNTDFHEAITQFPVEEEDKKGKVIEVIQKGYKLNEKVVRYSKVVVGQ
ncbi:MAG: nucleotide exchange factor GrpE [Bacteroidales bacterium]|nr:nucleotide exchange factor GrpE [Bacteroidales bacterium]